MAQYMQWLVEEEQALQNLPLSKRLGVYIETMIMDSLNLLHLIIQIYCLSIRRAVMGRFMTVLEYPVIIETYQPALWAVARARPLHPNSCMGQNKLFIINILAEFHSYISVFPFHNSIVVYFIFISKGLQSFIL